MSKELEALTTLLDYAKETMINGKTDITLENLVKAKQTLLKALTPPTAEELCKAIHGDTALKTFYKNGEFIFSGSLSFAIYNDGEKIILSKVLRDNCTLETFELISRYYKGESK